MYIYTYIIFKDIDFNTDIQTNLKGVDDKI